MWTAATRVLWPTATAAVGSGENLGHASRLQVCMLVPQGRPRGVVLQVFATAPARGNGMSRPVASPDLMPVEALWRWLREDVTYHYCHATAENLTRRVAAFEATVNRDPYTVDDRLWVKDHLDPDEEKLRFST